MIIIELLFPILRYFTLVKVAIVQYKNSNFFNLIPLKFGIC